MPESIRYARELRKHLTDAERKIWNKLRKRQVFDYKFRRQAPIGSYIVDFVCYERKVVIEIDGGQHKELIHYDEKRTKWLEANGFRVLRFWNNDVLKNVDSVIDRIAKVLGEAEVSPPP